MQNLKWRQIETVPMNTSVLLFYEESDCIIQGICHTTNGKTKYMPTSLPSHGCGCCASDNDIPSHWMSLPKKPKA